MPDIKIPDELKEYLKQELADLLGPIGAMIAPTIVSEKQEDGQEVIERGDVIEVTPVESDPRPMCSACRKRVASLKAYEKKNGDLAMVCERCYADLRGDK